MGNLDERFEREKGRMISRQIYEATRDTSLGEAKIIIKDIVEEYSCSEYQKILVFHRTLKGAVC